KTKEHQPAGFWVRAIALGTDLAIIDILTSFLAYRGSFIAAGHIILVLTVSYFFFSWLFFAATPAMMLARIKILSKDSSALKIWQVLVRLAMFLFLFVGWIPMLFDKKERKALHDMVSQTRVVYTEKEIKVEKGLLKSIRLIMLGLTVVLLIGLLVHGLGEKLTKYTENDQITLFDFNQDGLTDGLTMDVDKDGSADVFKYDLNNDRVIDFTTFDTDKDGVAESIDINNDGRIDGFDFDNDNILDILVSGGQFYIWLWKVLFGVWAVGFVGLLGYGIFIEKINHEKDTKK
ncbi:MAG: RDD family protein, partial [Candidatus Roizmanbacteria bacterium]|nr:RDD family protein [Candidatus Roizmanbacteria bacterium]